MSNVKYPILTVTGVQCKVSNFNCHWSVLEMSLKFRLDNTETGADFLVLLHLHRPLKVEEEEHQVVFVFSHFRNAAALH